MSDITSLQFPPVTAVLLASTAVVTLPCLLGILPFGYIYLNWSSVVFKLQVWRIATNVFFGGTGFPLIMDFFLLFRTSTALEAGYVSDIASYVWTLVVLYSTILILNVIPFFHRVYLFRPTLTSLLYLWSKENPTAKVNLFGLVSIPTRLYPFALIVLDLIQNGPHAALGSIMGLLAGHLYWFLTVYLPLQAPTGVRRPNPLPVPRWFRQLFRRSRQTTPGPASSSVASGVNVTNFRSDAANEVRHRWGSGQRLGGSAL